ncbi:MAG: PH domain-containing protein [Deltaproteobacteria bacterium]|nr:PH domain-containing protein [Deltaproteobacteria bacterium]
MDSSILSAAVAAAVVPLVLTWLLKSQGAAAVQADGTIVLSYSKAWRAFVYFFALIPPVIAGLALLYPPKPEELWIPPVMALGFAALIAPLGWEVFRFRLEVRPDGLCSSSPWKGTRTVAWPDVESLTFNASMQWYVINCKDGTKLRVSAYATGTNELKSVFRERKLAVPKGL